jgi:hypothetical protein
VVGVRCVCHFLVGALQQELATVGAQLSAVLESYAQLLRTFEAAVSRRKSVGSLAPGAAGSGGVLSSASAGSSPRLGSRPGVAHASMTAHPSPLGLASRMAGLVLHSDMPPLSLDGHAPGGPPQHHPPQVAGRAAGASHVAGGPIRVVSPRLMQAPEEGGHALSPLAPASQGGLASTVHTRLPPLRVAAPSSLPAYAPPSPAPPQQQQPGSVSASLRLASPTTQSKRALFDAVAEAAAAGSGLQGVVRAAPLSGFLSQARRHSEAAASHAGMSGPASSALLLPSSPSRLRPVQSGNHAQFSLEQPEPGSPGLLRLGPTSTDALSSSPSTGSLLRLDPFRASGGDAFLFDQSPPMSAASDGFASHSSGPGSAVPGPPLALTPPVAPGSPRGPLRGMRWSTTEGGSPTAGSRLRELSPKRRLDMPPPASKAA